MRDYNDYIKATREYLKNYKQLQATVKNLEQEANEKQMELEGVRIAVSNYGGKPGGNEGELTVTEAEAAKRGQIKDEITRISGEVRRIKGVLERIDCAIDSLDDTKKRLIQGYFMDGLTWRELSIEQYMTEKWASNVGGRAIREIAFMIFGSKALPPEKRFIFL